MRKRILSTVAVTITAAAADGAQKRFEMSAYTGEPMSISGFDLPIVIDLSSVDITQQRIPILYDHCPDVDFVVGQSDSITCDGSKIIASGVVNGVGDKADKVRGLAAGGYVWQASIGAEPSKVDEIKAGESVAVNGREYPGPCYVARGCVLREISFVVLGGDRKTSALVAKNKSPKPIRGSSMTFPDYLSSLGFADQSAIDPEQLNALIEKYAQSYSDMSEDSAETDMGVETPANAEGSDPVMVEEEKAAMPANAGAKPVAITASIKAGRALEAAEIARVSGIKKIAAKYGDLETTIGNKSVNIIAHAIQEGWTRDRTELEAMRVERKNNTPNVIVQGERSKSTTIDMLTAAVMLRAGCRLDNEKYGKAPNLPKWLRASINDPERSRIMDGAHRFSDLPLHDVCREILQVEGKLLASYSRQDMIQAAMSGSNFANIFTTSVNASLLGTYLEALDSTESWTSTTEVADFKTNDRIRVQVGEGLTKRARGQEADHTSFTDQVESYAISQYARQFTVDEIDIVNDSMGAIGEAPQKFGLAAARLRPDLVYAIILANANLGATARALFNTTDGNTTTGALTAANLEAAVASMSAQRENSVSLNVPATHLIVPAALQFTARQLLTSTDLIRSGTTDAVTGSRNVIPDLGLQLAVDARLQNGVTDPNTGTTSAGSSTAWFLASTYMNTIEVAYLRGSGRAPRVRSTTYDRDGKYGVNFDVSLSIGAKAIDWRGLWRRTG